MAKVVEIEVRVGATKQLPNYESARLDYGARVVLEEGEKGPEALEKLRNSLTALLRIDINKVIKKEKRK